MRELDDNARSHAAFWNGSARLRCLPASITGGEATQAMPIIGELRRSQIALSLKSAPLFPLDVDEATALVANQIKQSKLLDGNCDDLRFRRLSGGLRGFSCRRWPMIDPSSSVHRPELPRSHI
jgi:hypothetical protein